MYDGLGLFIDGAWRPAQGGAAYPVVNPATEEVLGQAPLAGTDDIDAAIASAAAGLKTWRAVGPWERSRILRKVAELLRQRVDEMARIMTLEVGKPLAQSRVELQGAADQFDWYADETRRIYGQTLDGRTAGSQLVVTYEPVGVVAAFSAWNFPAGLMARKIAPALAAGCSIICRPSEDAPGTCMHLVRACADAGVPKGVVNLLTGKASVIAARLMASPVVRKVTLTGSTNVGKAMLRASADTLKRLTMELGGHAPVIVHEDADVEKLAPVAAVAKFRNAGQVCVSPSRFYIHESKLDAFAERFTAATRAMKIGDGLDPATEIGPLIGRDRVEEMEKLVADSLAEGATLRCGGGRPSGFNRGYFFEPTVFTNVRDDGRLMTEETFGPIAPITSFRDMDEVVERANSLSVGLASYVFTRDLKRAQETVRRLEAGMVGVNTFALASAETPFGGIKESGFGREGGSLGIKDYLDVKYAHLVMG